MHVVIFLRTRHDPHPWITTVFASCIMWLSRQAKTSHKVKYHIPMTVSLLFKYCIGLSYIFRSDSCWIPSDIKIFFQVQVQKVNLCHVRNWCEVELNFIQRRWHNHRIMRLIMCTSSRPRHSFIIDVILWVLSILGLHRALDVLLEYFQIASIILHDNCFQKLNNNCDSSFMRLFLLNLLPEIIDNLFCLRSERCRKLEWEEFTNRETNEKAIRSQRE